MSTHYLVDEMPAKTNFFSTGVPMSVTLAQEDHPTSVMTIRKTASAGLILLPVLSLTMVASHSLVSHVAMALVPALASAV
jgi:hypothetical protein